MRAGNLTRDTTVGARFVVRELADRGASGAVYRATDLETNADVALKVIVWDDTPEQHFLREARILEKLRHPSIVAYVAHGTTEDGNFYLALEWLAGETLSARLRRSPLTMTEALFVIRAVAGALTRAHAEGVIHRDIKPSNVFLTNGGEAVKLIDFGIAQLAKGTRITRTGTTLGTPAYMAPEQARGIAVDGRADIFSLGCVLYRCLTGSAPFAADGVTATLAKVLFEEPAPLRTRRRDAPVELEALVMEMLAKDPAARVSSAVELLARLDRVPGELRATSIPPADASGPSLTMTERRFVTVVLARPDGHDVDIPIDSPQPTDATLPTDAPLEAPKSDRLPPTPKAQIVKLVDGTLAATFGAPTSALDHAEQAAHCALSLQQWLGEGRIVLATGLGVVEGRVPMGEVIERAAAMLDRPRGKLDGILVDALSARLLDARFDVVHDGDDVVLIGERRSPAQLRTLLGKPSPHVGRERELALLAGLVDESVAEATPLCAVVTGASGLGKSRLVSEVMDRARTRHPNLVTWFARGDRMSAGSSFGLASDLLRDAAGARRGEPASALHVLFGGVLDRCGAPATERDRVASALAALVGKRDDEDVPGDPRSFGDRLLAAWEDFVRRVAGEAPLAIVIDDLQWGDLASVRLLEAAMRNLQTASFCVVATARPDVDARFADLWSERRPLRIELSDLSPRAARRLVTGILGDVDDDLAMRIVERAAGNAFHLEELVRAVAEGRGGALPETVLAMVSDRLQALDPEARRLLRAASIFGETFWEQGVLSLLGDASEPSWTACAEQLTALVRHELVVVAPTSQFAGDVEYRFRHSLVRDAAYAALTDPDRAVGHRIAGEWLVAAGCADARALAEHFERGGVSARAASYYLRAAQQSLLGGDVSSVLELCARSRSCDPVSGAAELARLEADAHFWQGDFAGAEASAERCLAALHTTNSVWWSAAATLVLSCVRREGWDRVFAVYETMRSAPFDAQSASTRVVATSRVAVHLCAAGRFAEADELLASIRANLALVSPDPATLGVVRAAEAMRALCAGDLGVYHDALTEASALFERGGDLRNACNAECNLGFCRSELGAYAEAESVLTTSMTRARRLGLFTVQYSAMHNLGYALFRLGRAVEARAIELDCAEKLEQQGDRRTAGGSRLYLALIALETGDLAAAEAEIDRALALLAETPPVRAFALAVLARTRIAQGRMPEAADAAAKARALLAELGAMEQGESYVRLVDVEARIACGDVAGARRAAADARQRLLERASAMRDDTLRRSFLERVPEHARTFALAAELGAGDSA